jgi:hypothetical protein
MHTAIAVFDDSERLQRALDRVFEAGVERDDVHVIEGAPAEGADLGSGAVDSAGQNQDPEVARANMGDVDEGRDEGVGVLRGSATDTAGTPGETRMATPGPAGPFVAPGSTAGTPAPAVSAAPLFGSVRGLGIDDEEARFFEERLQRGGAHLLAVKVRDDDAARIYDIFRQAGASQTNDPND